MWRFFYSYILCLSQCTCTVIFSRHLASVFKGYFVMELHYFLIGLLENYIRKKKQLLATRCAIGERIHKKAWFYMNSIRKVKQSHSREEKKIKVFSKINSIYVALKSLDQGCAFNTFLLVLCAWIEKHLVGNSFVIPINCKILLK